MALSTRAVLRVAWSIRSEARGPDLDARLVNPGTSTADMRPGRCRSAGNVTQGARWSPSTAALVDPLRGPDLERARLAHPGKQLPRPIPARRPSAVAPPSITQEGKARPYPFTLPAGPARWPIVALSTRAVFSRVAWSIRSEAAARTSTLAWSTQGPRRRTYRPGRADRRATSPRGQGGHPRRPPWSIRSEARTSTPLAWLTQGSSSPGRSPPAGLPRQLAVDHPGRQGKALPLHAGCRQGPARWPIVALSTRGGSSRRLVDPL